MFPPHPGSARAARDQITEDALFVHPAVVGLPLARPWRRACAMAIDGVIVAFLAQAPGVLFALVAAYVLFRASGRSGTGAGYVRTSVRFALRSFAALLLFVMSIAGWDSARDRFQGAFASLGGAEVVDAGDAGDEAEESTGVGAMAMAAVETRDTASLATLRPVLGSALASDTLGVLATRIGELEADRSRLRREVTRLEEAAERPGILRRFWAVADDLGLGVGWMILYFTAMVGLWQGRTPGKKALGIRVVRLNAKPITWWVAFERAGGYWAGLATGLLGFFQILWDRNRQGIHDKITETAVVRER